jgi:hypothetical protein
LAAKGWGKKTQFARPAAPMCVKNCLLEDLMGWAQLPIVEIWTAWEVVF